MNKSTFIDFLCIAFWKCRRPQTGSTILLRKQAALNIYPAQRFRLCEVKYGAPQGPTTGLFLMCVNYFSSFMRSKCATHLIWSMQAQKHTRERRSSSWLTAICALRMQNLVRNFCNWLWIMGWGGKYSSAKVTNSLDTSIFPLRHL